MQGNRLKAVLLDDCKILVIGQNLVLRERHLHTEQSSPDAVVIVSIPG